MLKVVVGDSFLETVTDRIHRFIQRACYKSCRVIHFFALLQVPRNDSFRIHDTCHQQ